MSIIPYFISSSDKDIYFVANNPLIDTFHQGLVEVGGSLGTGQPIIVLGDTEEEALNLIYSHVANENDIDDVSIPHEVQWSVGYNLSDATIVRDLINSYEFVNVNFIKHPDRNEYAIPFQNVIFNAMPDDANKASLLIYATASVSEGRRRSNQQMNDDGWCMHVRYPQIVGHCTSKKKIKENILITTFSSGFSKFPRTPPTSKFPRVK